MDQPTHNILNRAIAWAEKESAIKALVLLGSHPAKMADPYSDFDLAIFCSNFEPYIHQDQWLNCISKVWVCVHEKIQLGDQTFPTRLVIFEGGDKIDFAFYSLDVLNSLVHSKVLPDEYNKGYTILLDKQSLIGSMPKAAMKESPAIKPSGQEFQRVIEEFWFEVHHIAKYLKRNDLWSVKFRSGSIHDHFLLKMIEWNEEAKRNWESKVPPLGKRMRSWVTPTTWEALHQVFAHFDREDSTKSLMHLIALFRSLALDTSKRLGYTYPVDLDTNICSILPQ